MTAKADAPQHEPLSTRREIELLSRLRELARECAQTKLRLRAELNENLARGEQDLQAAIERVEQHTRAARNAAATEQERTTAGIHTQYALDRDAAQNQYKNARQRIELEYSQASESARQTYRKLSFEAHAVYDSRRVLPQQRFQDTEKAIQRLNEELALLEQDAVDIMKMRRQWRELPPTAGGNSPAANGAGQEQREPVGGGALSTQEADESGAKAEGGNVEESLERISEKIQRVRRAVEILHDQRLPRMYENGYAIGLFVLLWGVAAIVCGLMLGWHSWHWVAASAIAATLGTAAILVVFMPLTRRRSRVLHVQVQRMAEEAREGMQATIEAAQIRGRREARQLLTERDRRLGELEEKLRIGVNEKEKTKEQELGHANAHYPALLEQLREDMKSALAAAAKKFNDAAPRLTAERDNQIEEHRRAHDERRQSLQAEHDLAWQALTQTWRDGLAAFQSSAADIQSQCARLFPDWETTDFDKWPLSDQPTPAIQFGRTAIHVRLESDGLPGESAPANGDPKTDLTRELPTLLALDEHPVMAITAENEGRRLATDLMQLVMLRFLTAMPPGKVRFTILDPVGLGENFASFMHLADFDEQLVASRIWTDGRQIEEQLTRLTNHMETVLQKYLRNEFATIHEYNEQAGEVAEPFQVLVVANFPTNFNEAAARKLVSVVTSGPRCGVFTVLSADGKLALPSGFAMSDVLADAVHLDWIEQQQAFRWKHPVFENMPLELDPLPSAERLNEVIRSAGRAAKNSMKVEVPFQLVAPDSSRFWKGSTAKELVVPIGRAGAMRLQEVRLGRGTSQHLLVCGKTGSGKSTFLHALITNAALYYSPDEVEFYLIDFKKGVEFKTYATHRLPHARVIAIESEREFGLSVLERLDAELRRRGDLFRAAGVQDLNDFRAARPAERMPRVLLVVDEFQELFVEDDKLSQEAALLLDRLVRQGRAFGIHILLGSQTLSGAYSLARSTMGQMAVRVALQCSETDASLILSDERNTAARFLNRPGDAIYNDQNGQLAGNHPFQVVWLSEQERIEYLKQIEEQSKLLGAGTSAAATNGRAETIVFEGDQLADPANNSQLLAVLENGSAESSGVQRAWLGSAVAIKEPTAAVFERRAGSNLLVVGAWDDSALGVLANAVIALAAQNRTSLETAGEGASPQSSVLGPRFYILDGTRPDAPEAGAWEQVAAALPGQAAVAMPRDAATMIQTVAAELSRREEGSLDDAPSWYLVVFNGGRFRDLRRGEDDYSFSMDKDKPPSPDKQFATILKDGPSWGIHTMVWCDSNNNVNRMLDRMLLREFDMRVAFQMSAADSASLLDNPAASRLRQHRGLFASEDVGTLEKFRPYGPPTEDWLKIVLNTLRSHVAAEG